jgi:hypothetical protein
VSEFEHTIDIRHLPAGQVLVCAGEAERAALAARFGLIALTRLEARVRFTLEGAAVYVTGQMLADVVQACAVSGEDLPVAIAEPVALRFVPAAPGPIGDVEVEIDGASADEIEFGGTRFDLGEALAQGLALAIDPFAKGPGAAEARQRAGLGDDRTGGAFAALAALRRPAGGSE